MPRNVPDSTCSIYRHSIDGSVAVHEVHDVDASRAAGLSLVEALANAVPGDRIFGCQRLATVEHNEAVSNADNVALYANGMEVHSPDAPAANSSIVKFTGDDSRVFDLNIRGAGFDTAVPISNLTNGLHLTGNRCSATRCRATQTDRGITIGGRGSSVNTCWAWENNYAGIRTEGFACRIEESHGWRNKNAQWYVAGEFDTVAMLGGTVGEYFFFNDGNSRSVGILIAGKQGVSHDSVVIDGTIFSNPSASHVQAGNAIKNSVGQLQTFQLTSVQIPRSNSVAKNSLFNESSTEDVRISNCYLGDQVDIPNPIGSFSIDQTTIDPLTGSAINIRNTMDVLAIHRTRLNGRVEWSTGSTTETHVHLSQLLTPPFTTPSAGVVTWDASTPTGGGAGFLGYEV